MEYVGGLYHPSTSFADEMERLGERPFFPWFIVYDFESLLIPVDEHQQTIHWKTKHQPVSVSVCSNIPCYIESKCFVQKDLKTLLKDMVMYMSEIE